MKLKKINIAGQDYLLCFSALVMSACEEKDTSLPELLERIETDTQQGKVSTTFWLLYQMLLAGAAYAKRHSLANPDVPEYEDMLAEIDITDLKSVKTSIYTTITHDNKANVEVEPSKNQETTPGD